MKKFLLCLVVAALGWSCAAGPSDPQGLTLVLATPQAGEALQLGSARTLVARLCSIDYPDPSFVPNIWLYLAADEGPMRNQPEVIAKLSLPRYPAPGSCVDGSFAWTVGRIEVHLPYNLPNTADVPAGGYRIGVGSFDPYPLSGDDMTTWVPVTLVAR